MTTSRGWRAALVVALLALTLAPGAPAQPIDEPQVTDAEGDATENNSNFARGGVRAACMTLPRPAASQPCRDALASAPHVPSQGGVPASPAADILAAWFAETPEALVVTLQVASLAGEPDPTLWYIVDWGERGPGGCYEYLWGTWYEVDGKIETSGTFDRFMDVCAGEEMPPDHPWAGMCSAWGWCSIGVRLDVRPGTPGELEWTIPRDVMPRAELGDSLDGPGALAARVFAPVGASSDARVDSGLHPNTWTRLVVSDGVGYALDAAGPGSTFTFGSARAPGSAVDAGYPHKDIDATSVAPGVDILALDVEESATTLTLAAQVREVSATATADEELYVVFTLPSDHLVEAGYEVIDGERVPWACYPPSLVTVPFTAYATCLPLAPELIVEPGSPGTIRLAFPRAELPPIPAGGILNTFYAEMEQDPQVRHRVDAIDTWVYATPSQNEIYDNSGVAPPYRFLLASSPLEASGGLFIDGPGDATPPPEMSHETHLRDQFDVTHFEARWHEEGIYRLSIGLQDASAIKVPSLYDAVFYALGMQTAQGATMIGYHKTKAGAQAFFCAPDTTVLTETKRDPTEAVWSTIEGIISLTRPTAVEGGQVPGVITYYVPAACFGPDAVEPLDVLRFEAATYAIRAAPVGSAQIVAIDTAVADAPFALHAVAVPVTPAAWYVAPFGLANFWDMLGLAAAIVIGGTGAGMKLHRRKLDKLALADAKAREDRDVYRAALVRAVATRADLTGDEVLGALRRRLGISEREHAILELEARAVAGVGIAGLTEGARFLGKYRVERQLGEGGFARTFLARDEKLARRVVLKIARWPSPDQTRRAIHEARALAQLDHPNIVKIHDVDEVADQVVLVLEYVAGGALSEADRPSTEDALRLVDGVLAALEAAHAQGIVHRDVKPANILLTRDGMPKLADFGVARLEIAGATVGGASVAGAGAGTVRYMAPEQARGQGADARSDLYSVGVVLYELLAGRPYLDLENLTDFEARAAVAEDRPALPLPAVGADINALLARALAKDPAQRPQRAREMRSLLSRGP